MVLQVSRRCSANGLAGFQVKQGVESYGFPEKSKIYIKTFLT